jgi:hypothetical protein
LIGPYKNAGSDYRPKGRPDAVNVHDFVDKELGKAIPYGVYDIGANAGCVSVGINHDTAQFAVNAIRGWRDTMGRERYPQSDRLMISADGGGSNGSRVRLWKVELQMFADETGVARRRLPLSARHIEVEQDRTPPVLSHHAELAHRPLTSRSAVVELIAATSTKTGLTVRCELDPHTYEKGISGHRR